MHAKIIGFDEHGNPTRVCTDDGFAQVSRPYDPNEDGWMKYQLDPSEFVAIKIGRDTEWLVDRVNSLQRENFQLQQEVKRWQKASGMFGA